MDFYMKDQDMYDWLSSRTWLFYITGYGRGMNLWFSYSPRKDFGYEEQGPFLAMNDPKSHNTVWLDKEDMGTYAHPRVALTIREGRDENFPHYRVQVGFKHVGSPIEQVFDGFVLNLSELLEVFRYLGVAEPFLTGHQQIP